MMKWKPRADATPRRTKWQSENSRSDHVEQPPASFQHRSDHETVDWVEAWLRDKCLDILMEEAYPEE